MPQKIDRDSTSGRKLLMLFQILMLDDKRHYLGELAERLNCSRQTIGRLIAEIEGVIGASLQTGLDSHRRWYRLISKSRTHAALDFEELRYLRICRDLATPYLPRQMLGRLDDSIFRFSMMLAESGTGSVGHGNGGLAFFSKGRIDYSRHYQHIDSLMRAVDEKIVCHVAYRALGQSADKIHIFAPGHMLSMNNALYVAGASLEDDFSTVRHYINLAIHRIHNVELAGQHFDIAMPALDTGTFGLPWHEPKTFRIIFKKGKAAEYVRERIWAEEQIITDLPDGGIELSITTRSQPELEAWVRSFGKEAKLA